MFGEFAVIDFETTGLSANYCRVIEVGAVIVRNGEVTDSFVELMHPGCNLPYFITDLTGITNAMLKGKPKPEAVMPKLKDFIGDRHCVAHNATFDSGFYHAEMGRAGLAHDRTFFLHNEAVTPPDSRFAESQAFDTGRSPESSSAGGG